MTVQSPGGLFGNVTVDNLEDEHSTRNARLMRMLEDLHVVENRGSGVRAMVETLPAANLEPPRFDVPRSFFRVVFHNHTLMSPSAVAWLNQFAPAPLNDGQRVALVYARQHADLSSPERRRTTRVDALMALETTLLTSDHPHLPPALKTSAEGGFTCLWAMGNPALLRRELLGLFCSTRCPGDVILQAYDAARALRSAGTPVIGGFHTPMEQECLDLLLRGTQPVVWCPARGLPNPRRLPKPRREALAEGRLLIFSPFEDRKRRMTADRAELRNELVAQIASRLLFLHAPPGSKTDALRRRALARGKPVLSVGELGELSAPDR